MAAKRGAANKIYADDKAFGQFLLDDYFILLKLSLKSSPQRHPGVALSYFVMVVIRLNPPHIK